ncbi:MAG: hypothetical protein AAF414_09400 [Pseudomonadota bacterium]
MARAPLFALLAASLVIASCDENDQPDTDETSSTTESDSGDSSAADQGSFDVVVTALGPASGNAAHCGPVVTYTNNTESVVSEYIFNLRAEAGEGDYIPVRCPISDEVAVGASGEAQCSASGASCTTLQNRDFTFTDTQANCDLDGDANTDWGLCASLLNVSADITETDLGDTEITADDIAEGVAVGEGLDIDIISLATGSGGESWCAMSLAYTNNTDNTFARFNLQLVASAGGADIISVFCNSVGTDVAPGAAAEAACDVPVPCATLEGREIFEKPDGQQCQIEGQDGGMDTELCASLINVSDARG